MLVITEGGRTVLGSDDAADGLGRGAKRKVGGAASGGGSDVGGGSIEAAGAGRWTIGGGLGCCGWEACRAIGAAAGFAYVLVVCCRA